jgi:branched-chain amino acid transport system permease protein
LLAASVVGGSRTWAGSVIGAAIVVYLPTVTESVVGGESAGNWSQLVYALALLVCLTVAPNGLAGGVASIARRFSPVPRLADGAAPEFRPSTPRLERMFNGER